MQVSAVSQQQHACMSTAGVVAHCAAVPLVSIRGDSVNTCQSTSQLLNNAWVFFDRTKVVA